MSITKASVLRLFLAATLLALGTGVSGQVPDAEWYPEFRIWFNASIPREDRDHIETVAQRYREKLQAERVNAAEIDRRLALLRTRRQELENEYWNRVFTGEKPSFNTEPNAFLVSVVKGLKPGKALDMGMGEGRNALFLAKVGWDVTGVDPAEQAVALAAERAATMHLRLQTAVATDTTFAFGDRKWDLVLYSWVPPDKSAAKVVQSLRPGGVVVVEAGREWFSPNGLLKMFDALRIVQYEDRLAPSDFFGRREMPVEAFSGCSREAAVAGLKGENS